MSLLNNGLQATDISTVQDNSNPREQMAQMALLKLLQDYPEAAKYLGTAALPYLQNLQLTDPTTANRRNSLVSTLSGLQQ